MTTVAIVIGVDIVSSDVLKVDTEEEEHSGVSTLILLLKNLTNKYGGHFTPNTAVSVTVEGLVLWTGTVDDSEPWIDKDFEDVDLIKVIASGKGAPLIRTMVTKKYENWKLTAIIADSLALETVPITYTPPTPHVYDVALQNFKRTYLNDGWRALAKDTNYAFYVDISADLKYFPIGATNEYLDGNGGRPNVDLIREDGNTAGTILDVKEGECYGSKLYNYIEAVAGFVSDHWTEGNASDFTPDTGVTISDDRATPVFGKAYIKIARTSLAGPLVGTLNINNGGAGRYTYTSLDMSVAGAADTLVYWVKALYSISGSMLRICRPRLTDTLGAVIEFKRHIRFYTDPIPPNGTETIPLAKWTKIDIPYGSVCTIAATETNESWWYVSGANFDWAHVASIQWNTGGFSTNAVDGYMLIDGLRIPTIECRSIKQDVSSIATYGKRMKSLNRVDASSQLQLDAAANGELYRYLAPLQTLWVLNKGDSRIKYVSQSLDVKSPPNGIAVLTRYRIISLKHHIRAKTYKDVPGFDYTTEMNLIAYSNRADALYVKYSKGQANEATILRLLDEQRMYAIWLSDMMRQATMGFISTPLGIIEAGTTFPTNPTPDQTFYLTAAIVGPPAYGIGYYRYDEATASWNLMGSGKIYVLEGTLLTTQIGATTITLSKMGSDALAQMFASGAAKTAMEAWRHGADLTLIDGGDIYTGSITLGKLSFVPLVSAGTTAQIVATINASAEGIKIDADNIKIAGTTEFTAGYDPTTKVAATAGTYQSAASGARVLIFPDANTAIRVIDDAAADVFKALVGGADVGDVIIGNFAGNKGLKWDKSLATFTVRGTLVANDIASGTLPGAVVLNRTTGGGSAQFGYVGSSTSTLTVAAGSSAYVDVPVTLYANTEHMINCRLGLESGATIAYCYFSYVFYANSAEVTRIGAPISDWIVVGGSTTPWAGTIIGSTGASGNSLRLNINNTSADSRTWRYYVSVWRHSDHTHAVS